MTHNEKVLALLSDGEPHSHHELYDLRVIAHSRVAALRAQGHTIECWKADGLHWYRLLDEPRHDDGAGISSPENPEAGLVEQAEQLVLA
jgi:hypothetical protein